MIFDFHFGFHKSWASNRRRVLPWAIDPDLAERLWHLSEKMTGVTFSG